jgi:hypothetical protein
MHDSGVAASRWAHRQWVSYFVVWVHQDSVLLLCCQYFKFKVDLLAYLAFYLNIGVDSAFGVYAHALEVLICGVGLILLFLRQSEKKA